MPDLPPLVLLVGGLALLAGGAEALVRGSSRLAFAAGLSRLVVGLVVVSVGTSAPEVAVSIDAALAGKGDLALGNVIGSNTFNVLFVLGLAALVAPLAVRDRLVRLDIPLMVGASLLLVALALDGSLGRLDGAVLVVLAAAYLVFNLRLGRREAAQERAEVASRALPLSRRPSRLALATAAALALGGLAGLVIGARLAVWGATDIARALGASDLVIGLTVIAVGTSLPEVGASVVAVARGERDIAVGNVVGSNVLNVLLIMGLASMLAPGGIAVTRGVLTFDFPVMVAVSLAVLPIAFTAQVIERWEGVVFLGYYAAYATYLLLTATEHPAADQLGFAMTWFVIPLTLVVLATTVWHELRRRRKATAPSL